MKHKPTKKKIQNQTQYAHIQKKKNSNFTPTHSAAIDQPAIRNHQIDFESFTIFWFYQQRYYHTWDLYTYQ